MLNPENEDSFTSVAYGLRCSLFIGLNSVGDKNSFSSSKVTDPALLLARDDEQSSWVNDSKTV